MWIKWQKLSLQKQKPAKRIIFVVFWYHHDVLLHIYQLINVVFIILLFTVKLSKSTLAWIFSPLSHYTYHPLTLAWLSFVNIKVRLPQTECCCGLFWGHVTLLFAPTADLWPSTVAWRWQDKVLMVCVAWKRFHAGLVSLAAICSSGVFRSVCE